MKTIITQSLKKSYSYQEYRNQVSTLLKEGKSTGNEQSADLTHYSELNEVRMNRLDKTMVVPAENIKRLQEIIELQCKNETQYEIFKILIENIDEKKSLFQLFNNLKLKDTTLINSYMQDSILKNVKFDNIDFTKAQIFNTRLKDIDLSTCIIQGLSTTLADIKGAIINELQIMDLAYLLNIKIKK